jgi:hypothetical protein
MIGLENGILVQHASLGLGKVVAVEPKAVHVVFAAHDARVATKLRLPMALSFLGPPASTNAWLSALTGFELDAATGRYGRTTTWLSHADAVARFTEAFPRAFEDPAYLAPEKGRRDRAARWRRAQQAWAEAFGEGRGEQLLAAGDVAALVARTEKIERIAATVVRDAGRTPFEAARHDPALARAFFAALFDLVSAATPTRAAFEALAAAAAALGPVTTPEAAWPIVTLLPFLARPEVHMLLRPHFACDAAQRLGLELAYDVAPNWATYDSLLASTRHLLERLRPLGARDHVDVEAFMHAVLAAPARPKAKAPPKGAAAKARAAAAAEAAEAVEADADEPDAERDGDGDGDEPEL